MSAESDPDAALMLCVKQGDLGAFAKLVDRYKQPITNFAYRMLRDAAEAEDMAQTAFVQAFNAADRYEVSAKFSTWLFTIARNLCLNEIRRRARHRLESMEAPHPAQEDQTPPQYEDVKTGSPTENLLLGELEEKIEEALAELPENQRLGILLWREGGMSYEEIARVVGCSPKATKSAIYRGRETLKQKLKPYLQTGVWEEPK